MKKYNPGVYEKLDYAFESLKYIMFVAGWILLSYFGTMWK